MVTKQLASTNAEVDSYILAKNHMVTKLADQIRR